MSVGRVGAASAWAALATAGLAFWFLVGFPFGHHNESYDWVAWIGTPDLASVAWHRFFGAGGYRPLAMSVAWLSYRAGDGSLVPIQLFNFALTLAAWWTLAAAAPCRRTFSLAALVAGGVLFAGYIFLFHLHGVFYGPLLLGLALAVRAAEKPLAPSGLALLGAGTLVAAAAHTYALALGLAFVAGTAIERGWLRDRRRFALALVVAALGLALIVLVAPRDLWSATSRGLLALVTSFRAVEVNRVVALVAALLAIVTAATTRWPFGRAGRTAALLVTLVGVVGCMATSLPVVFAWLVVGLVKAALHGRWTLAFLLLASLGLPYAGASGSPTYAIFALLLLTWILALDADGFERAAARLAPAHAWAATAALVVLGLVVGRGVEVPGVSHLARPLLAEKERTHQGERLLAQVLSSPWRTHPVRLAAAALAPTEAGGAVDRRERAPTNQICLDNYLNHARGVADPAAAPVVLSFGGGGRTSGSGVLVVPGRWAGDAVAALPERAQPVVPSP
ncbi:MAG: hypothetical protein ABIP29_03095 [Candidatus Eisenbacteria bacterium]